MIISKYTKLITVILFMGVLIAGTPLKPDRGAPPTRIYVDQDATGANDGSSWEDAFIYLQDALDLANAGTIPDYEIWVAEGVYYPDLDSDGDHTDNDPDEHFLIFNNHIQLYGGFSGVETSRLQRDWAKHMTILSGDIDNNDVNMDGNHIAEDWTDISGTNAKRLIFLNGSIGEDITKNTVIDGFLVTAADNDTLMGGGLMCWAGSAPPAGSCSPTLRNLRFQGNRSYQGGGMALNAGHDGVVKPDIVNVVFEGNYVYYTGGGMGIYASGDPAATINPVLVNLKFRGNYSVGDGGGLIIYAYLGSSSPSFMNVEFYENESDNFGGGIVFKANDGIVDVAVNNATFNGNSAGYGGGICTFQVGSGVLGLDVQNSILWGDSATDIGPEIYNSSATPIFTESDIQGCGGSSSWDTGCGSDGGGNLDTNPMFKSPAGGDLSLQSGSPVIDEGDRLLLPNDTADLDQDGNNGEKVQQDLDMFPRVQESDLDMGAYEHGNYLDNVGFHVPSKYRWYLKTNRTDGWSGMFSFGFGGVSELIPVMGDWDGDGVDTPGFYKPSQWRWYLKNNQTDGWVGVTSFGFGGVSELIPVVGDWDGNGTDTPGFYKPSEYKWLLKNDFSTGWTGVTCFNFGGAAENIPITGDWDGDGRDTVGFFVPSQNRWYLKDNLTSGWTEVTAFNFGVVSDMDPVTGDWNGGGKDTVGFYVPSQWKWYLKDNLVTGWSGVTGFKYGVVADYEAFAGDWE